MFNFFKKKGSRVTNNTIVMEKKPSQDFSIDLNVDEMKVGALVQTSMMKLAKNNLLPPWERCTVTTRNMSNDIKG
ncbi:hypothetical protein RZN25_17410, partial [Bacillaceae bacterium S4-13-56]